MKIIVSTLALTCLLTPFTAFAQDNNQSVTHTETSDYYDFNRAGEYGAGVQAGSNTGLTFQYWASDVRAIDALISVSGDVTLIGADYLWHAQDLVPRVGGRRGVTFSPYLGAGLIAALGPDQAGTSIYRTSQNLEGFVRIPVGLELQMHAAPVGVFAQIAPNFAINGEYNNFLSADVGARWFF